MVGTLNQNGSEGLKVTYSDGAGYDALGVLVSCDFLTEKVSCFLK